MLTDYVSVLQFFVGAALLCFAYGYMYRRTKEARFREDIFTMRDEMFDYMWQHDLAYSHPAYLLMRSALNGAIRVSGFWSLPVFLTMAYYAIRTPPSPEIGNAIETLPKEHRQYFYEMRWNIFRRLIAFVFLEGFFGWILGLVRHGAKRVRGDGITGALHLDDLTDPLAEELAQLGRSRNRITLSLFQGHERAA